MKFAFFGTPDIARIVLDELAKGDLIPSLIVTNPDALVGRKQTLTSPPVKVWAEAHGVPIIQPASLKTAAFLPELTNTEWDVFVVVAYGKIIPQWLLDIPKHGTLNVHPSLLPVLRGASPIRSAILSNERATGITIMLMDALMDHGPIIIQKPITIDEAQWPQRGQELDELMAREGGQLLRETLPRFAKGELIPTEQDHEAATFCTKITKEMSELVLDPHHLPTGEQALEYLRKVRAFDGWPETFFIHEGKRIKIKDATLVDGTFYPTRIIPEGKKEMNFNDYFNVRPPVN